MGDKKSSKQVGTKAKINIIPGFDILVRDEDHCVELAYKVASTETPFGFEFVQKVIFRDVNFGEAGRGTEAYSVAGIERARPGFGLCRHCGKVQPEFEQEPQHSFDCPHKSAPAAETMIPRPTRGKVGGGGMGMVMAAMRMILAGRRRRMAGRTWPMTASSTARR